MYTYSLQIVVVVAAILIAAGEVVFIVATQELLN